MKTKRLFQDNKYSVIKAVKHTVTEKAILIHTVDGEECWLPLSEVNVLNTYPMEPPVTASGDIVELDVPNWLVSKNNIV